MFSSINGFIADAYSIACKHGFHDVPCSFYHHMMLVVCEVCEVVEADRCSRRANLSMFSDAVGGSVPVDDTVFRDAFVSHIKDSVEDELADVCIRLFDMCGYFGIVPDGDSERCVSMRADWDALFGDMSFCERSYALVSLLLLAHNDSAADISDLGSIFGSIFAFIQHWCDVMGIDILLHIRLKMRYNSMRGYKHGKCY